MEYRLVWWLRVGAVWLSGQEAHRSVTGQAFVELFEPRSILIHADINPSRTAVSVVKRLTGFANSGSSLTT